LFGYEGGAFTGARARGKPEKFELAKGGTLFLDEIGDMPLHLQSSLLRAVQSGEIVRVGGTSPIQIETRIICATNRPLSDLVDKGTFRPDLFYRLDVFQIAMPSLRDRSDKEEFIDVLLSRISHRQGIAPLP
jgi:transcriptional regulator with PAS, ATPase and Fis domain